MYPILARYGSLFIYSYTVVWALGIIAGIGLLAWMARYNFVPDWFDLLLIVFVTAILGGRIGFILLRLDYFQERPSEIWHIWQGGLSYHAALLAGLFALAIWTIWKKRSFYRYTALLAPAFALVTVFGWTACWLEGCAYGREAIFGPLVADLPDDFGVFALRYQSQMVGIFLTLLAFFIILWLQKRLLPGPLFLISLAAVSLAHLLVTLLRGDPTIYIGSLRLDTLLNSLLVFISLLLLQYEQLKIRHMKDQL